MQQVKSEKEFHDRIGAEKPTVAVFKANWCRDCHFIEPFMPDVEAKYADRLDFIQIDRDELPDLSTELNILGIPSFVVFARGQELTRFVSKLRKTREEIEEFLDKSLAVADVHLAQDKQ